MKNNIIDNQAGLKLVILNELDQRMRVHLSLLKDIKLSMMIGLTAQKAATLAKEIKDIQDKLMEKSDQVKLYVLPETREEVIYLIAESNLVCDTVRKKLRSELIGN